MSDRSELREILDHPNPDVIADHARLRDASHAHRRTDSKPTYPADPPMAPAELFQLINRLKGTNLVWVAPDAKPARPSAEEIITSLEEARLRRRE